MFNRLATIFMLLVAIGFLTACGSATIGAQPTATPAVIAATATVTTITSVTTSTAIPITSSACTGTQNPDSMRQLQIVPFPDGTDVDNSEMGDINGKASSTSFQVLNLCTKDITVNAVLDAFVTNMPKDGWSQSAVFPYNNDITSACSYHYCWKEATTVSYMTTYASLELVHASGNNVIYTLRIDYYSINA